MRSLEHEKNVDVVSEMCWGEVRKLEEKKTLKELYQLKYDVSEGELYPLQEWYNGLIDKTVEELTIFDTLRMLRQDVCMDVAMLKTIEFLFQDVFAGESYDGQALENLLRVEAAVLMSYADILQRIVAEAQARSEDHEWWYEGEKEEFLEVLVQLSKKIGLKDGTGGLSRSGESDRAGEDSYR